MFKKIIITLLVLSVGIYFYSGSKMNVSDSHFLDVSLTDIEQNIEFRDELNPEVSKVAVAWHLDHMLKTVNEICKALEGSDPTKYESGLTPIGRLSLTTNFIPRGKAQSPDAVRPPDIIETQAIIDQLAEARERLKASIGFDEDTHFDHPYFGTLNKSRSLRFIEVHTNHHLKIVRDILKE